MLFESIDKEGLLIENLRTYDWKGSPERTRSVKVATPLTTVTVVVPVRVPPVPD